MKKILIFLIIWLSFQISYAKSWDMFLWTPTIKELSANLEKLKEEKQDFTSKAKELKEEYWDLISFIKDDLTSDEIEEINDNVEKYLENKKNVESELNKQIKKLEDTTQTKKEILILRANFYKYLAKYIQKDKKEDFINHIRFQIQSEKESKDLIEEILKNQNLLEQKVSYIKEKIEDHKENLQAQIESKISQKIKDRIEEIDSNQKYDKIDQKVKNKIYKDFTLSIEKRIKEVKKSNLTDNYKEMRINILSKMIEEIKTKIK